MSSTQRTTCKDCLFVKAYITHDEKILPKEQLRWCSLHKHDVHKESQICEKFESKDHQIIFEECK